MRTFLAAFSLMSALAASAHAAGAYAAREAHDAAVCARLCADDGLCLAWTFTEQNMCELRATAPAAPLAGLSGFSSRAPASLRQPSANQTATPAQPATRRAAIAEDPPIIEAPPVTEAALDLTESSESGLLGGPASGTASLRPRLGLRN